MRSKVINNTTSSFPIEIIFANEAGKVLHGQALSVKIFLGEKQAHRLPQSVLVLNADLPTKLQVITLGHIYLNIGEKLQSLEQKDEHN
ncbi:MAG: hypothetical protein MRQ09_05175 [Candidatus Midichloria sp.]|nr:hypothetical protein [Candidatus Midichloria sp.]